MRVIIDRFEEDFAVVELENGDTATMPRVLIPDAKEGDFVNITLDATATKAREGEVKSLFDRLFVPKGDKEG